MSLPTKQTAWVLANPPTGPIEPNTFSLEKDVKLPELKENELLVKMIYLSNDPAQRGWMQQGADPDRAYLPPIQKGEAIRASGVAEVLASNSQKYKQGDRVMGRFGWFDVGVVPDSMVISPAIELPNVPTASLSVLGMVAVTAYQGIFEVLKVEKEHVVVISGAAGAVGSLAIQLAKHVVGAKRVIGVAGGPEKCDWVVNHLGADACVDYKKGNIYEDLKAALGDKVYADRYFDNVGGDTLNSMFKLIARHGKIGVCGMISGYMGNKHDLSNFGQIVSNRVQIEGFLVLDMLPKWMQAVTDLKKWISEGKIQTNQAETIVDAPLEKVPEVWQRLFKGENRGKLITRLV